MADLLGFPSVPHPSARFVGRGDPVSTEGIKGIKGVKLVSTLLAQFFVTSTRLRGRTGQWGGISDLAGGVPRSGASEPVERLQSGPAGYLVVRPP